MNTKEETTKEYLIKSNLNIDIENLTYSLKWIKTLIDNNNIDIINLWIPDLKNQMDRLIQNIQVNTK
jgi:hypothetical protein